MPRLPSATAGRRPPGSDPDFSYAQALFRELLSTSIVLDDDWNPLDPAKKRAVAACRAETELFQTLVELGLLNAYQASRLRAGKTFGLVLGNYRVLDRLGAGGMGVIYLAEHTLMRKRVAIKTLSLTADQDPRLVSRFTAEIRAVGQLRHPNIVSAIDAGKVPSRDPDVGTLHYFVMEYLPGQDL